MFHISCLHATYRHIKRIYYIYTPSMHNTYVIYIHVYDMYTSSLHNTYSTLIHRVCEIQSCEGSLYKESTLSNSSFVFKYYYYSNKEKKKNVLTFAYYIFIYINRVIYITWGITRRNNLNSLQLTKQVYQMLA